RGGEERSAWSADDIADLDDMLQLRGFRVCNCRVSPPRRIGGHLEDRLAAEMTWAPPRARAVIYRLHCRYNMIQLLMARRRVGKSDMEAAPRADAASLILQGTQDGTSLHAVRRGDWRVGWLRSRQARGRQSHRTGNRGRTCKGRFWAGRVFLK